MFKQRNFTLRILTWLSELVMRPVLNTIGIPLSSYQATIWWKIFKIILTKDLKLWRGNTNQVQYSCVSQWYTVQQLHRSSKNFQSSFTINTSLEKKLKFSKSSSSQLSLKTIFFFKKFSKVNSSNTWVKKFQKVFNTWLWNVRKFLKIS